jgi:hypothetical protein
MQRRASRPITGILHDVVNMVSAGREGRAPLLLTPHDQYEAVHHRHRQQPQRQHGIHRMYRVLGQAEADPGDQHTQQRAAGIAEEHFGTRPPRQPHVPDQKARERAAQHGQSPRQQFVAGIHRGERQHGQRRQPQQACQSIRAVDHVDRIDDADGGEYRERHGQPAQRHFTQSEHRADLLNPHSPSIDDDQGCQGLPKHTGVPAHVAQVIVKTHHHQQERRRQQRMHGWAGRLEPQQHHRDADEDRQSAGDRGGRVMILAPAGVVQQPQPAGQRLDQPQYAGGDHEREQGRQWIETKKRLQHPVAPGGP